MCVGGGKGMGPNVWKCAGLLGGVGTAGQADACP